MDSEGQRASSTIDVSVIMTVDVNKDSRGTLTPRIDWSWRSSYFIDSANTLLLKQQLIDISHDHRAV